MLGIWISKALPEPQAGERTVSLSKVPPVEPRALSSPTSPPTTSPHEKGLEDPPLPRCFICGNLPMLGQSHSKWAIKSQGEPSLVLDMHHTDLC